MSSAHPFTCVTCALAWETSTSQRAHFQTDLHRYNSKRKAAGLQPITAAVFNDKIAQRRENIDAVAAQSSTKTACKTCNKSFSNANVYNDHLNSKKHRENVLKGVKNITVDSLQPTPSQEADTPMKGSNDESSATIPPNTCLFCPRSFTSLDIVLKHMAHNHAFYIPDQSYCADIPGLLAHLAEDIALGNICIFCGHGFGGYVKEDESDAQLVVRAKRGLKAVREHMVAKNHCRIPWDAEMQRLELSEYYNYESSYPDYQPGTSSATDDTEMVEDDGEWQDDDDSSIDEDDEVIMDYSALERKTKKPMEQDLDQRIRLGENDYELVLPSGARIGHRALKGVYKQNVMPYVDLNSDSDKVAKLARVLEARQHKRDLHSSALIPTNRNGLGGEGGGMELIKARNAGEAKHLVKENRMFREHKRFMDHKNKVGKVGNNQKHFRDPLLQ